MLSFPVALKREMREVTSSMVVTLTKFLNILVLTLQLCSRYRVLNIMCPFPAGGRVLQCPVQQGCQPRGATALAAPRRK